MIEHLENDTLERTIKEFKRISSKYILITTPNNEDIDKTMIKCPSCGYIYNINYHLQRFSEQRLINFFPNYRMVKHQKFGQKIRSYKPWLSSMKRRYTPSLSWIPFFWRANHNRNSMCPNCEESFNYPYKFNLLALMIDAFNIIISPKTPHYQLCLFEKNTNFRD
jgi:hypothetical protein